MGEVLTNEGDICPRRLKVDVSFCLLDDGPIIGEEFRITEADFCS